MIRNGLGAMIFKEREEGIFKGMGGGESNDSLDSNSNFKIFIFISIESLKYQRALK